MNKSNKTENTSDNKSKTTNEIRITLQEDSRIPHSIGNENKFATVTITLPAKYKDYEIVGVSHQTCDEVFKDVYGNESEIGDYDYPVFGMGLQNIILNDIYDLLNISIVNKQQLESLHRFIGSSVTNRIEKCHDHARNIRVNTDLPNVTPISATLSEN